MRAMLPRSCEATRAALEVAELRDRLFSTLASGVISDDLLVNNVGVSAAYQSPPHFDVNDIGWTFAFSAKCGDTSCTAQCRATERDDQDVLDEDVPLAKIQRRTGRWGVWDLMLWLARVCCMLFVYDWLYLSPLPVRERRRRVDETRRRRVSSIASHETPLTKPLHATRGQGL